MLLEEMKEIYLDYVRVYQAEGTFICYKGHLDYLFKWFKKNNIISSDDISNKLITKFILMQHQNGIKNSTINKRIKPLKMMFKYCEVDNEILYESNLKESYSTFSTLSQYELNCLVEYLNSNSLKFHNKLIFSILIDTGVRLGELLKIKTKNINFNNNTILLEITKTKENRIVPFTLGTKALLEEYLKNNNNEFLINIKYSSVESLFRRVAKRLNLVKFHPHMLRHTLSTKLNSNGVSLFVIQKIMGHKNVATTQRYIHIGLDNILESYNSVM